MTREDKINAIKAIAQAEAAKKLGGAYHKTARGFLWLLHEYKGQQRKILGLKKEIAALEMRLTWHEEVEDGEDELVQ